MNPQADSVRDAVANLQKLHLERPQRQLFARRHLIERDLALQSVLSKFGVDQAQGELRPVNRGIRFLEQVRKGADMVFMAVGKKDSKEVVPIFDHIAEIREYEVDAQHVLVREHEPGIDQQHGVAVFEDHHVLADGPHAAKGYYSKRSVCFQGCLRETQPRRSPRADFEASRMSRRSIERSPNRQLVLESRESALSPGLLRA